VITFSKLGEYGRLGNQLFQYAVIRSVSLSRGYELKIPDPSKVFAQNQRCQLDQFNIECDYLQPEDIDSLKYTISEPDHTKLHTSVFYAKDNTDFFGYYQNYLYFAKHVEQIKQDLRFKKELQEFASDYVDSLKKNNEQIVSVHFRRGDNVDGTFGRNSGIIDHYFGKDDETFDKDSYFGKYFYDAIKHFDNKNIKFLVFSGGSWQGIKNNQGDINWCKKNLKDDRFIFCEGNNDMEDFAIMTNCDHNIISHSTSFGYWAALLNSNPNKTVIAPKSYAIPPDNREKQGFYPKTWRKI
jgi:hypothetical protein